MTEPAGARARCFEVDEPKTQAFTLVMLKKAGGTLRKIAGMVPGTVLAFDYFSADQVTSRSPFMRYARAVIRATGEPFKFGIDNSPPARAHVAELLASCGMSLKDQRNFGPRDGPETA